MPCCANFAASYLTAYRLLRQKSIHASSYLIVKCFRQLKLCQLMNLARGEAWRFAYRIRAVGTAWKAAIALAVAGFHCRLHGERESRAARWGHQLREQTQ